MKREFLFLLIPLPLIVLGAAPIALNGGGGGPAWSGGSFASVSTGGTGCAQYSFSSESTLGFGRAGADEFCIGTTTNSKNVSIKKNGTKTQLVFNGAQDTSLPHLSEPDNTNDGFVLADGTNPFAWVEGGTVRATLGTRSGRTYLCFGAWNTNGIPCFTSSSGDFVLMDSDGSSFGGVWDVGATSVQMVAGSAAAPSMYFDGDSNTGIYRSAADTVGVTLNGTAAGTLAGDTGFSIKPATGYYINMFDLSGAPAATCSGTGGMLQYDYTNHRLYVCNDISSTRVGWDYASLTD